MSQQAGEVGDLRGASVVNEHEALAEVAEQIEMIGLRGVQGHETSRPAARSRRKNASMNPM